MLISIGRSPSPGSERPSTAPTARTRTGCAIGWVWPQALLGRPELLILDEPTTGLDPAHIREVRVAIADAAAHGSTVLMSSHLLSEVEQVCTHAAVMRHGRLLAAGSVAALIGAADTVEFTVADPDRAREALHRLPGIRRTGTTPTTLEVEGDALRPAELLLALADAGVEVTALRRGRTLEDAYLAIVGGDAPVDERADTGQPDPPGLRGS